MQLLDLKDFFNIPKEIMFPKAIDDSWDSYELSYSLTLPVIFTVGESGGKLNAPMGKSLSSGGAGIFAIWKAAWTLRCQGKSALTNADATPPPPPLLLLVLAPEDDDFESPPSPWNQDFDLSEEAESGPGSTNFGLSPCTVTCWKDWSWSTVWNSLSWWTDDWTICAALLSITTRSWKDFCKDKQNCKQ